MAKKTTPKRKNKRQERSPEARAVNKAEMLKALEQSLGIVTKACLAVGIERKTHYLWLENDADYAASVAAIQEQALDHVEDKLFKLIDGMETAAVIFYLKTKGKSRGYIERVQTQEVKPGPFVIETDRTDNTTTT